MDLYMTPRIRIANKLSLEVLILLNVTYPASTVARLSQMIKILMFEDREFTAEDLLSICVPFGNVISVQKIMRTGYTIGLVAYSNAHDALMAKMELNDNSHFVVSVLEPREIKISEGPRSPCLPQDWICDMPPPRLPNQSDTLNPPASNQGVHVRIHNLPRHADERYHVLRLLPSSTTVIKVDRRRALVALPDVSTALRLKDLLTGLYTGSRRLYVSFAKHGGAACLH